MTDRSKIVFKLATGLALLAVLFFAFDWRGVLRIFGAVRGDLLLLALLVLAANLFMSAWKWQRILFAHELRIPFAEALRAYWVGSFFSNFLPTNVGGDVVRLMCMRRHARVSEVTATIAVERLTGAAVLVTLCLGSLVLRPWFFDDHGVGRVLWLGLGGVGALLLLIAIGAGWVARWLGGVPPERAGWQPRVMRAFGRLASALHFYGERRRTILLALAMSVPFYVGLVLTQYLILRAVGTPLPFAEVFLVAPLVIVSGFAPITLNGLGVSEGAFVLFYSQTGLPVQAMVAAALVRRLAYLLTSAVGGLFWIAGGARATVSPAPPVCEVAEDAGV